MNPEHFLKLITGTNKILRESSNVIKESAINYIEKSLINGRYVSREEHEQLKSLVLKMQKELENIKIN